eukprot:747642-Hanusia_phi.AAC.1
MSVTNKTKRWSTGKLTCSSEQCGLRIKSVNSQVASRLTLRLVHSSDCIRTIASSSAKLTCEIACPEIW